MLFKFVFIFSPKLAKSVDNLVLSSLQYLLFANCDRSLLCNLFQTHNLYLGFSALDLTPVIRVSWDFSLVNQWFCVCFLEAGLYIFKAGTSHCKRLLLLKQCNITGHIRCSHTDTCAD